LSQLRQVLRTAGGSPAWRGNPKFDLQQDIFSSRPFSPLMSRQCVPVSYPNMKPPIETRTPIAKDRGVKNLTGVLSYAPETFSGSGPTCWPAEALSAGRLLFVLCFDRERTPILGYSVCVDTRSSNEFLDCRQGDRHFIPI